GRGVVPSTVCSVEEILDMGYVVAREKATSTFKIQNTCTLALRYSVQLDSLSSTRDKDRQRLPSFITSSSQRTEFVGTQNYSGLSVFSVFPTEGEILAGKSQDFIVTFSPDHESLYYSDRLKVVLFGKKIAHVIHLKGAARDHPMFVEGGVPLDVPVESLAVTSPVSPRGGNVLPLTLHYKTLSSILLVLEYIEGESSPVPAVTELKVGDIRTAQFPSKKNVEFSLDDLPLLREKGFSVEPAKGKVERGQVKAISVSWVPPADFTVSYSSYSASLLTGEG
ncbi:CFA74 protein, partial [Trogon melanurus]|nr:CFA74 protein [Trogon melanurus]